MTAEDATHLATLLRANLNNDATFRALLCNNFNTILAALDLAPVALAAIAYHDRNEQPADADKWHAWDALAKAVERYRTQKGKIDA